MLDHFQMGPNLVRGFAPAGIGPRDLASPSQDALGGSMYWGASVEAQSPIPYIPRDVGLKVAAFADAGSLWDYKGPQTLGRDRRNRFQAALAPSVRSIRACRCALPWAPA